MTTTSQNESLSTNSATTATSQASTSKNDTEEPSSVDPSIVEPSIIGPNYIAALDIGSNSFHFVYGRVIENHLQILHTEKYRVKLASGLNENNELSVEAITRGVATLENLATTVQNLTEQNFRAVATYTLRQANNKQAFLDAAAKVFPFDIEIISGHEEARLIYQGIAHNCQPNIQQLVIDIGGGSTECVIGINDQVKALASLTMGCVSFTQQYFIENSLSKKQFSLAINAAKHQINSITKRFKKVSWQSVTGTSGTIKAIHQLINVDNKKIDSALSQPITLKKLYKLQQQLINFECIENIDLNGLKENRKEVICAGLAILIALMEALDIDKIDYSSYALREGVLYEQLSEMSSDLSSELPSEQTIIPFDIRQKTINSLMDRFSVDVEQAEEVKQLAIALYQACANTWNINEKRYKNLLIWAALLHEIGIDINPSSYHKHGQYIIENSDLAGFNQEQQQALAWLIGCHRKKLNPYNASNNYQIKNKALTKVAALLRLAVLLNQQRQLSDTPAPIIKAEENVIELVFDQQWLIERPIVDNDLFFEQQALNNIDITLTISTQ